MTHISLLHCPSRVTFSVVLNHGKKLREARDQAGWTQDELAAKAKISRSQLQKMERGGRVTRRSWLNVVDALRQSDRLQRAGFDVGGVMPRDELLKLPQGAGPRRSPLAANDKAKPSKRPNTDEPMGESMNLVEVASLSELLAAAWLRAEKDGDTGTAEGIKKLQAKKSPRRGGKR